MVLGGTFMAGEVKDMDKLLRARSIGTGSQEGLTGEMARANLSNAFKEADTDGSGQVSREELLVVLTQVLEMVFLDPVVDCAIIFVSPPLAHPPRAHSLPLPPALGVSEGWGSGWGLSDGRGANRLCQHPPCRRSSESCGTNQAPRKERPAPTEGWPQSNQRESSF